MRLIFFSYQVFDLSCILQDFKRLLIAIAALDNKGVQSQTFFYLAGLSELVSVCVSVPKLCLCVKC